RVPVGSLVAKGEVALGFQQLSELMNLPGITLLGGLPEAVQIVTTFSAAQTVPSTQIAATRSYLDFLASAATAATKRQHGMEPA
ncbi:MAG: substrate-binding domain-containing protein, partial [Ottowia sp.]|nr:substrate-binding domain-containing protein [Ottowia sp.]